MRREWPARARRVQKSEANEGSKEGTGGKARLVGGWLLGRLQGVAREGRRDLLHRLEREVERGVEEHLHDHRRDEVQPVAVVLGAAARGGVGGAGGVEQPRGFAASEEGTHVGQQHDKQHEVELDRREDDVAARRGSGCTLTQDTLTVPGAAKAGPGRLRW